MKKQRINPLIAFPLFLILISGFVQAQVPQGIPYQAVARNGQGLPLANLPIKVRFSILDSTLSGSIVYSETHEPITSALGLFSVNVGMGNPSQGTFSGINWGLNAKFLKVELDTTATGSNYIYLGTQQMMSVPYALFAGSAYLANNNNGNSKKSSIYDFTMISEQSSNLFYIDGACLYCDTLTESGFTDWILPGMEEWIYLTAGGAINLFSRNGNNLMLRSKYYISGSPILRVVGNTFGDITQYPNIIGNCNYAGPGQNCPQYVRCIR